MIADLSLYLITDAAAAERAGRTVLETVGLAVAGGVTAVQVRDKRGDARAMLELAVAIGDLVPAGVSVLVNDRVDVFLAARRLSPAVVGVHIGQRDLPVEHVRALAGPDAVLGLSASTEAELGLAAASAAVDYVGIGAVRATATKPDAPLPLGIDGVVRLSGLTPLPAVAIGGIGIGDAAPLRAGGLAGIAVAAAIGAAADPSAAAAGLASAWRAA